MRFLVILPFALFASFSKADVVVAYDAEKFFRVYWAESVTSTIEQRRCPSIPKEEDGLARNCRGQKLAIQPLSPQAWLQKVQSGKLSLSELALQVEQISYELQNEDVRDKSNLEAELEKARGQTALLLLAQQVFDAFTSESQLRVTGAQYDSLNVLLDSSAKTKPTSSANACELCGTWWMTTYVSVGMSQVSLKNDGTLIVYDSPNLSGKWTASGNEFAFAYDDDPTDWSRGKIEGDVITFEYTVPSLPPRRGTFWLSRKRDPTKHLEFPGPP